MAQKVHAGWNGPSAEIVFAFGLFILVYASVGLHSRLQLEKIGILAEGIVQKTASCAELPITQCKRAMDRLTVAYQDDIGQHYTGSVYASSRTYLAGQSIKLKYLPTQREDVVLAPGERGESNGTVFQMTLGSILTLLSGLVLAVKWGR